MVFEKVSFGGEGTNANNRLQFHCIPFPLLQKRLGVLSRAAVRRLRRGGLFSAQSGESRPPRSAEDEERWRSRGVVMVVGAQDGDGQSNNTPNTHHLTKTPPSLDAVKRFALQELPLAANPLRFAPRLSALRRYAVLLEGGFSANPVVERIPAR